MEQNRFNIDFFEFSFLVEACIPPRPIARAMFWDRVIDEYWFKLTKVEVAKLFTWITRNQQFDASNEDCRWFYDRYNPDNQYLISTDYKGELGKYHCFMHEGLYHSGKNCSIIPEYIVSVEKVEFNEE
jgi:hypothetical protein